MKFNEKLRELRIKNKLTQEDIANKLNISRQSVSKWEQGINEPNIETLKQLCNIFDVDISELIDDDKDIILTKEQKLKKIEHTAFILNIAMSLLAILITLSVIRIINNTIPMHYNMAGVITRYGSKYELLLFCVLSGIFLLISTIAHKSFLSSKRAIDPSIIISQFILALTHIAIIIFMITYAVKFKKDGINETIIMMLFIFSLIMVVSIFVSPYFVKKQNPYAGFRTEFTLNNKIAWKKVNMMQSILGFSFSLIGYIITIIFVAAWSVYLIGLILLSLIPSMIYHEVLRKKIK